MTRCRIQGKKGRFRDAVEAEERLVEQLIIGIRHTKIQEMLLSHDDMLTLDVAMDIARTPGNRPGDFESASTLKPATGRPCVLALGDSGTVPAITSDCSRVAELLMRRRYFDLCVTASSRTILTSENNVSCSSRDCSTIAFCRLLTWT